MLAAWQSGYRGHLIQVKFLAIARLIQVKPNALADSTLHRFARNPPRLPWKIPVAPLALTSTP